MEQSRENLGSRLGFILLTAGCAIGLGNIWRFPFVTGQNGGAFFVLFYLFFLIVMGFPVMVMELAIGRRSRRTLYGAVKVLPQNKKIKWHWPAGLFFSGSAFLMIFYTTVTGWMIAYACYYLFGDLSLIQGETVEKHFSEMVADPLQCVGFMLLTVIFGSVICGCGLKNGVERVTKLMMAGLFGLLLILSLRSLLLPGAAEGLKFYLMPDWGAVERIGVWQVIVAAMGQAFFSLSIGVGSIAIFGSYIERDHSLAKESLMIIALDTVVAVFSGIIIFPACATFGVDVTSGPGLVFVSLPEVFNSMRPARLWGALFFLFMSAAALTTVVAVFENLIAFMMDEWKFSRLKASWINGIGIALFSLPCALGFNVLSRIQPLGAGSTILDLEDYIVSDNLLPLGGVFIIIICGSPLAWGWRNFIAEANAGQGVKFPVWAKYYLFTLLPLAILTLFLLGFLRRWC